MKKFNRILSVILAVLMLCSAVVTVGAANVSFTDVSGHWAWTRGQIPYLVSKDVLNGYKQDDGTYKFLPDGVVTRAEYIKILDESFGLTKTKTINYSDVKSSDWYYTYIQKAAAQGYLLNYGTKLDPDGKITREEAVALLVRYLDLPANEKANASAFTDYSSISSQYADYVMRAVKAGVIEGYEQSNGKYTFEPKNTLTRAEALTIIYKAAGCIFNKNTNSRDNDAHSINNVITRGGVTISRVRFNGRSMITEGVTSGIVALSGCDINDTFTIRGTSEVIFDNCTIENLVVDAGCQVTFLNGTVADNVIVKATSNMIVNSDTTIKNLTIEATAPNVSLSGEGTINFAKVVGRGFSSRILPEKFEIADGVTATFAGEKYEGTSETQSAFTFNPYIELENGNYYLTVKTPENGYIYYYYTNTATAPTSAEFSKLYQSSRHGNAFDTKANVSKTVLTYKESAVKDYKYIVIRFESSKKKYDPIVISNSTTSSTGFVTDPYFIESSGKIQFKSEFKGTVYWYYTDSSDKLSPSEFMEEYNDKESALKSPVSVNANQSYSVTPNSRYTATYGYVAFMLKASSGVEFKPVIVSLGITGFTSKPALSDNGTIKMTPAIKGTLYYYYATTDTVPSADLFATRYTNARYKNYVSVSTANRVVSVSYNSTYISSYPYMVFAMKDTSGEYMQPVVVEVKMTDGFTENPYIMTAGTIAFKTILNGQVEYYFTDTSAAPSSEMFDLNYAASISRGRVSSTAGQYRYIQYNTSLTAYSYIVIRFTDVNGNVYTPVVVALSGTTSDAVFKTEPTVLNNTVYFETKQSGDIYYYYTSSSGSVSPSDFYNNYLNIEALRPSYCVGSTIAPANTRGQFAINSQAASFYGYIVIGFRPDTATTASGFTHTYVVRADYNGGTTATNFTHTVASDGSVVVTARTQGFINWYATSDANNLPSATFTFADGYIAASVRGSQSMYYGETITIDPENNRYVVINFVNSLNVTETVTVTTNLVPVEFDDGANQFGHGFTANNAIEIYSNHSITMTPDVSGIIIVRFHSGNRVDEYATLLANAGVATSYSFNWLFESARTNPTLYPNAMISFQLIDGENRYHSYQLPFALMQGWN